MSRGAADLQRLRRTLGVRLSLRVHQLRLFLRLLLHLGLGRLGGASGARGPAGGQRVRLQGTRTNSASDCSRLAGDRQCGSCRIYMQRQMAFARWPGGV